MADAGAGNEPDTFQYKLIPHREFYLISGIHHPELVDEIQNWEIRDSDIFIVTYPKSGTIWMQQILRLIEAKGDVATTKNQLNYECIPWIEVDSGKEAFDCSPSPRIRVTHLDYKFVPNGLKQKKGKVIYVARNPKDVLVSYYHFHKYASMLETPEDFNSFYEKFLDGKVYGNCWFDHIKAWYSQRDSMNFLYITYEDMIQDLPSAVDRICVFLDRTLTAEQRAEVVEHSTFQNMRNNPTANYEAISTSLLDHSRGAFLRKGTIGDWKNCFTVAQNERFDRIFKEEMRDLPLTFVWDIADVMK